MMLNIIMIAVAIIGALLAKRGGRRRRYIRGNIDSDEFLGSSLAANTGIRFAFSGVLTEKAWISSVRAVYSMTNYTVAQNAGPIQVYLAHSDYTLSEFEAWRELTGSSSWTEGGLTEQEINRRGRKIKLVGQFGPTSTSVPTDTHLLNGGRPITTKLGWVGTTGQTVAVIFYNTGTAAMTTTSAEMQIQGHANIWPM